MNSETEPTVSVRPKYLNIACGGTYIIHSEWENVDYSPHDERYVTRMNVLHDLQPSQAQYEAVYCSHFIEHIPSALVPGFLKRCYALTAPGGIFRVVVPDAEFLMREYLRHKEDGNDDLADFAYVNFLDQCVRQKQGGRLGELYQDIADGKRPDLVEYATFLNGTGVLDASVTFCSERAPKQRNHGFLKFLKRIGARLEFRYIILISRLLPSGFRSQNVSFADVGERHQWMYDFDQLSRLLKAAGFSIVRRQSFDSSHGSVDSFLPLDSIDGMPRKGHHQLFVEAYP